MTRRDDNVRLRHMLDHAQEAVELAEGNGAMTWMAIVCWSWG